MMMTVVALRRTQATQNHAQKAQHRNKTTARFGQGRHRIHVFTERRIDLATAVWALAVPSAPIDPASGRRRLAIP